jgi:hypothetical protein
MSKSEWVISTFLKEPPIETSKTAVAIPRTVGLISSQIASAFGQTPVDLPQRTRSVYLKQRVAKYQAQEEVKRGTFMTEAEVQERRKPAVLAPPTVDVHRERTFEELMKEVDDMQSSVDSLEEVRRNIKRCQMGLETHTQTSRQLNRVLEGLESQLRPYAETEEKKRSSLPPVNPRSRRVEYKKTTDLATVD